LLDFRLARQWCCERLSGSSGHGADWIGDCPVTLVDDRAYDFDFLRSCTKPKLFVSGSRDQFGPPGKNSNRWWTRLPIQRSWCALRREITSLKGRLKEMREAIERWVEEFLVARP